MSDHTPTTAEVREEYADLNYVTSRQHRRGHDTEARRHEFDRWLTAHDAEVRCQGPITYSQVEAAQDAYQRHVHETTGNWSAFDAMRAALEASRDAS